MSTTAVERTPTKGIDHDSRLSSVNSSKPESLSDYVRRIRQEKNLSTPDVERLSGGKITDAYVSRIENGHVKNVSPEKLMALAKGLQVPEDEIFSIARGKSLEPMTPHDFISALEALGVEQFSAYGGLHNLLLEDQQEIIAMVEAMVEQKLKRRKKKK